MHLAEHRITDCCQIMSPNCDERPDPDDISLIVIHCISLPPGEFGTACIDQLFCNDLNPADHPYFESIHQLKVSAHLLIKRTGEITQYVPFNLRAWHAGMSEYQGRQRCNDFSIGIELEGTDTTRYTSEQYTQLIAVIDCLLKHYPKLSRQAITGHSDIAPGRKTDPGPAFDWDRLFKGLPEVSQD
ncbi:MAG: 1,6-anhydro-N-acetylmuramyl-L-alanine amidase AmpD [Methylicorpusculum sp.]|uniref:1,6-anhydro-N-acetylmuramyl-L-alanine amidase AmpD n=1 Tax=Methylicorpusculum sp. TaxID=2713644 RepID=UPI0027173BE4|nr:1,6-anhydro-N-acetylmuramyl-L-alanine amidase AmpD [Methylicorpusculum sp.]MDO8939604.1 1,6-anhydro-N-acetylmuramyl-L-alanine amidase AmpD [Methylicorpusculum sp.]MDP2180641.1 1,6-anhydro-N-acetylmuramyl-L-alanine amidase AmpD [Methylicorpusculum sp.]MDP2203682.1 1,6-anhydro-N-acetylmuramyl-L-alanine amidase AmpD [Methylicorpusculum sp.]MDP3530440.1 1,6-anhydro-N-acetylmuramyl-L-alanine amidase AmpD [Methylicorpusculum sp.]MDZ4153159.1 1,6-anhydro-N-acetylmuramyl-L-alanine amidase AmpD [Met